MLAELHSTGNGKLSGAEPDCRRSSIMSHPAHSVSCGQRLSVRGNPVPNVRAWRISQRPLRKRGLPGLWRRILEPLAFVFASGSNSTIRFVPQ